LDAGAKDDGHKYFKLELRDLQSKLEERHYVSMAPFLSDLVQVFSSVILKTANEEPIPEDGPLAQGMTARQKEVKKVGKRILGRVKDMVFDAQRIEAELSNRALPGDFINVEELLENNLRARQGSIMPSVDGSVMLEDPMSPSAKRQVNGHAKGSNADTDDKLHRANGDVVMQDSAEARVNGDAITDKDQKTDDAIIRLQLKPGAETIPIINTGDEVPALSVKNGGAVSSTSSTATAPALSASGSTNPSHHPGPLTPPDHAMENGTAETVEGGVPWYLEAFDPRGTTIHEERWGGRDIMRSMSEDLSELGEDDLANLIPADALAEGQAGSALLVPPSAADDARMRQLERKKQAAKKRRKLGWGG
jgi:NuA3 HAT complex component NTO1